MLDTPPTLTPASITEQFRLESRALGRVYHEDVNGGLAEYYSAVHGDKDGLSALCISGGGIRSATFAWGCLTELAHHGLLSKLDYLSTVSGGGYIGSWLSAWIRRAGGVENVEAQLAGTARGDGNEVEPGPVQHLRDFNNYLTPKLGLTSADTWTLVAIILRNLILNWLVIVPLLLLIALAPRLLVSLLQLCPPFSPDPVRWFPWVQNGALALAGLCFLGSTYYTVSYLPTVGRALNSSRDYLSRCLAPMVLCSFAALLAFWWIYDDLDRLPTLMELALSGTALSGLAAMALLIRREDGRVRMMNRSQLQTTDVMDLGLAILVWGLASGLAAYVLTHALFSAAVPADTIDGVGADACFYATFGPPLLISGLLLGIVVLVGCTSRTLTEEDREWLGRSAGYGLMFCVSWTVICSLVLIVPHYLLQAEAWSHQALAAIGGVSGLVTALAGNSSLTPAQREDPTGASKPAKRAELLYKAALPAFLVCLLIGLSLLLNWVLTSLELVEHHWFQHHLIVSGLKPLPLAGVGAAILILAYGLGRFINVNKFSLHAMYENRLRRAYLSASAKDNKPHPFTGFAAGDDIPLADLRGQRPLHVVNLALNLVSGRRLAWQQRKASSFTATPYFCGSPSLGYRDSAAYGGGLTLGNAMTISGAAASPNMGYNSSPLVSFTMMLFNARLGAWLGNPGDAGNGTWTDQGPRSAVGAMVREAFGRTTDSGPYVYLSDGGHFENLALYEMVLRRCRTIVVLDSSADPELGYEDLGNALRKIRIDMNIRIEFPESPLQQLLNKTRRCAAATIYYSDVDSAARNGKLLYIKPLMASGEPPDVLSFARMHRDFPHQTTADQWFTEAQTESYRKLGIHTIERMSEGWSGGSVEQWVDHVEGVYLGGKARGQAATA